MVNPVGIRVGWLCAALSCASCSLDRTPEFAQTSRQPVIYKSRDPSTGEWKCVNEPGFEDLKTVLTVYAMCAFGDYLYAGKGGLPGFQIWRTKAEGKPPYHWKKVLDQGAGRGPLNQGAVAMQAFQDALYIVPAFRTAAMICGIRSGLPPLKCCAFLRMAPMTSSAAPRATAKNR